MTPREVEQRFRDDLRAHSRFLVERFGIKEQVAMMVCGSLSDHIMLGCAVKLDAEQNKRRPIVNTEKMAQNFTCTMRLLAEAVELDLEKMRQVLVASVDVVDNLVKRMLLDGAKAAFLEGNGECDDPDCPVHGSSRGSHDLIQELGKAAGVHVEVIDSKEAFDDLLRRLSLGMPDGKPDPRTIN